MSTGLPVELITVYAKPLLVPFGLVTVTWLLVIPWGTVHIIVVSDQLVTFADGISPNFTVPEVPKFVPVMVIISSAEILVLLKEDITGEGLVT